MKTEKRNNASTLEEVIENNTGMSLDDFLSLKDYKISRVDKFAAIVKKHKKIAVCGDYDVDGITATYIMVSLLKALKKDVYYRFPRRLTEGFGLSTAAIDDVISNDCTLIITVDNGISANEAVSYAKDQGLSIIITDHHLADDKLPEADLIINPAALPDTADFTGYCGAGIAYKIASQMITTRRFQEQCCVIAAIGTVADAMKLVEDNRQIVGEGLNLIQQGKANNGIKALIKGLQIDPAFISADDIGYRIAPVLNAPGRLFDEGAEIAFKMLSSTDANGEERAKEIIALNEQRKALVDDAVSRINEKIDRIGIKCPLIVIEDVHEGIVGIVAGQLAEKYSIPAIILTETEKGYKGSARAPEGFNLKSMLDNHSELLSNYGGHEAAAGLTVIKDKLNEFTESLQREYADYEIPEEVVYYDLSVAEEDLAEFAKKQEEYAPYGEGNPAPVILVDGFTLVPDKDGNLARPIGSKGNMLRFSGMNRISALAFNGAAEHYEAIGRPDIITAVGTVGYNHWNGWTFVQLILNAFDKAPENYLSLAGQVKQKIQALRNSERTAEDINDTSQS